MKKALKTSLLETKVSQSRNNLSHIFVCFPQPGVSVTFQQGVNWFSQAAKTAWSERLYKKNLSLAIGTQTRKAKSFSCPINLLCAQPIMKPLHSNSLVLHYHVEKHLHLIIGFINIFSRRATEFHRWAKLFEVSLFIRNTFLYMVKPGRQNHPHSQSNCPVHGP